MSFNKEHIEAIKKNYNSREEVKTRLKTFSEYMNVKVENTAVRYGSSSDIITCPVLIFYIQRDQGKIDCYYYNDEEEKFIKYIDPPIVVPFENVLYPRPI